MKDFLGLPIRLVSMAAGAAVGILLWQHPKGAAQGFLLVMSGFAFIWSITRAYFRLRTRFQGRGDESQWGGSLWTSVLPASRDGNFFALALLFLSAGGSSIGYSFVNGNDPLFGIPLLAVGLGQLVGIFAFRRFQRSRAS